MFSEIKFEGLKSGLSRLKHELGNFQSNPAKELPKKIVLSNSVYHTERQNYKSVQRKKRKKSKKRLSSKKRHESSKRRLAHKRGKDFGSKLLWSFTSILHD